jgi:hypothetical protein
MNEQEFKNQLDRLGSDLARWPSQSAAQARSLLEYSSAARDSLAAARALDRAFETLRQPALPAGLSSRILDRVSHPDPWERLGDWFTAALWRPALAAAVPLVVGFMVGLQSAPDSDALLLAELSELPLTAAFEESIYDE